MTWADKLKSYLDNMAPDEREKFAKEAIGGDYGLIFWNTDLKKLYELEDWLYDNGYIEEKNFSGAFSKIGYKMEEYRPLTDPWKPCDFREKSCLLWCVEELLKTKMIRIPNGIRKWKYLELKFTAKRKKIYTEDARNSWKSIKKLTRKNDFLITYIDKLAHKK